MKKNYLIAAGIVVMLASNTKAQDTLTYESFNFQNFYDDLQTAFPPANPIDPLWYNYDGDGLSDGSASGDRPAEWYAVQPFSYLDTANNVAIGSNSWFTGPAQADNWLVSPSFTLRAH